MDQDQNDTSTITKIENALVGIVCLFICPNDTLP